MRTVEINLYKFNELSPELQQKVIENNREIIKDANWYNPIYENYQKRFSRFFEVTDFYFSGFYNQGDGAMFEYSDLTEKLKEAAINHLPNLTDRERKALKDHLSMYGHGKHSGRYYHEKSCHHHFDLEWLNQTAEQSDRHENLNKLIDRVYNDLENYVTKIYEKLAKHLYKSLMEEDAYLTSDETIRSYFEENECEFTEIGEMINY